jgi:hypothetical protein
LQVTQAPEEAPEHTGVLVVALRQSLQDVDRLFGSAGDLQKSGQVFGGGGPVGTEGECLPGRGE